MFNTGKILSLFIVLPIVLTFGHASRACPALGGTYLRHVGWFHDEKLSVVQDRCRSITLVYSPNASTTFDEASPRYLLDDTWHPIGSGRLYRARVVDTRFEINLRRVDAKVEDPGLTLALDAAGLLALSRESDRGRPETLTYKRIETHEVPYVTVEIAFDQNAGWRVSDGDHAVLSPVLEYVDRMFEGLSEESVYTCELKAERSKARDNAGLLVYDVKPCQIAVGIKPPGA